MKRLRYLLYPFAILYGLIMKTRNLLFNMKILSSKEFNLPVINVGNITVGGTGKTPHIEYLVQLLKKDYNVAVLSRGYKRLTKGFVLANQQSTASEIGDEPFQIKHKFPDIAVAVDEKRVDGIEQLTSKKSSPNVILLDDAFQHRYVAPSLSILLMDAHHPIYKDFLMPVGNLRESREGVKRADIVIVTKCHGHISERGYAHIRKKLSLKERQHLFFTKIEYKDLHPINEKEETITLKQIDASFYIFLVTGIASPRSLTKKLQKYTSHISTFTYPDHHVFTEKDIEKISKAYKSCSYKHKLIVVTEKDAARLKWVEEVNPSLYHSIYYLPIEIKFLLDGERLFNQILLDHVGNYHTNNAIY